jgi:hypothetical protein
MIKQIKLIHDLRLQRKPNKEDFMWHAVPSMKSHVALHPGA